MMMFQHLSWPKARPHDSLGLKIGGTGPKNRQESKSGLRISRTCFKTETPKNWKIEKTLKMRIEKLKS